MAKITNTPNKVYSTHGSVWYDLKEVFKAAGGTVLSSSDGTTYNASGDQITHDGAGAGGMGNTHAWARVRMPDGVREVLLQTQGAAALNASGIRGLYSRAGFVGGTPGAVRVPTATDQQFFPGCGGGTDAAPTYSVASGLATVRIHMCMLNTPISGAYPWVIVGTQTASSNPVGPFMIMEPIAPGSYQVDNDPVVIGYHTTASFSATTFSGWLAYGTGSAAFVTMTPHIGPFDGTMGVDLTALNDVNGYPDWSGITGGAKRSKGTGATLAWKGPARAYPATANRASDSRLYWGSVSVLYVDATEPSVS